MPKLVIQGGARKGLSYRLRDQEITLGRDPSNTISISDMLVSRRHARIIAVAKDFIIEDLGSVNGTFVNDTLVRRHVLQVGDIITLGKTPLQFLPVHASGSLLGENKGLSVPARLSQKESVDEVTVRLTLSPETPFPFGTPPQPSDPSALNKGFEQLNILYRLIHDSMTIENFPGVLNNTLERILALVKGDRGLIILVDEETGELVPYAACRREGSIDQTEITLPRSICRQVLESGRSVLTSDAMSDGRFQGSESVMAMKMRSAMSAPIKGKERILGVIHVDTLRRVALFSKDDLELLRAIGYQTGIVIENAMLFAESRRAHGELQDRQSQLIEAEKLAALGKIAGGVAHEVLNPMTVIMGLTEMVCRRLEQGPNDPKNMKECVRRLKSIEDEVKRVLEIVNSISRFYGKRRSDRVPTDVNEAIEAALTIASYRNDGNIRVVKRLHGDLPRVMADRSQLQTVFLNLFNNAMDAMEKSGTLTINSSRGSDRSVKVQVMDTGCGIAPHIMEKIFTPLFTTKEEGKGTGLGLSITHDIVESYGGKIEVESIPGHRTVFSVILPSPA